MAARSCDEGTPRGTLWLLREVARRHGLPGALFAAAAVSRVAGAPHRVGESSSSASPARWSARAPSSCSRPCATLCLASTPASPSRRPTLSSCGARPPGGLDLDAVCALRYERVIANDATVRVGGLEDLAQFEQVGPADPCDRRAQAAGCGSAGWPDPRAPGRLAAVHHASPGKRKPGPSW